MGHGARRVGGGGCVVVCAVVLVCVRALWGGGVPVSWTAVVNVRLYFGFWEGVDGCGCGGRVDVTPINTHLDTHPHHPHPPTYRQPPSQTHPSTPTNTHAPTPTRTLRFAGQSPFPSPPLPRFPSFFFHLPTRPPAPHLLHPFSAPAPSLLPLFHSLGAGLMRQAFPRIPRFRFESDISKDSPFVGRRRTRQAGTCSDELVIMTSCRDVQLSRDERTDHTKPTGAVFVGGVSSHSPHTSVTHTHTRTPPTSTRQPLQHVPTKQKPREIETRSNIYKTLCQNLSAHPPTPP